MKSRKYGWRIYPVSFYGLHNEIFSHSFPDCWHFIFPRILYVECVKNLHDFRGIRVQSFSVGWIFRTIVCISREMYTHGTFVCKNKDNNFLLKSIKIKINFVFKCEDMVDYMIFFLYINLSLKDYHPRRTITVYWLFRLWKQTQVYVCLWIVITIN